MQRTDQIQEKEVADDKYDDEEDSCTTAELQSRGRSEHELLRLGYIALSMLLTHCLDMPEHCVVP